MGFSHPPWATTFLSSRMVPKRALHTVPTAWKNKVWQKNVQCFTYTDSLNNIVKFLIPHLLSSPHWFSCLQNSKVENMWVFPIWVLLRTVTAMLPQTVASCWACVTAAASHPRLTWALASQSAAVGSLRALWMTPASCRKQRKSEGKEVTAKHLGPLAALVQSLFLIGYLYLLGLYRLKTNMPVKYLA